MKKPNKIEEKWRWKKWTFASYIVWSWNFAHTNFNPCWLHVHYFFSCSWYLGRYGLPKLSGWAKKQPILAFFKPFQTTLKGHIFMNIDCAKKKFCACDQQGLKFACAIF